MNYGPHLQFLTQKGQRSHQKIFGRRGLCGWGFVQGLQRQTRSPPILQLYQQPVPGFLATQDPVSKSGKQLQFWHPTSNRNCPTTTLWPQPRLHRQNYVTAQTSQKIPFLGHFLVGSPHKALHDSFEDDCVVDDLTRWRFIQHLMQRFRRRWTKEYLLNHQIRTKWQRNDCR